MNHSTGDRSAAADHGFVIGTAGHVDHGKSTLVKALTGIDPDRLAEERARSMTIDLGFAWLMLPSGRTISIVDVPGHERFIKNMLAGVGGIDAAMLVIAADEGPMPQTDEHLAILDLLQVASGVVVLSKQDAVDGDWLDLVREEVGERISGTVLANAPIVAVSALTGAGLTELLVTVDSVLDDIPERGGTGHPRMPIDRAFSVAGFGTVVTGTLLGGPIAVGQEIRLEPSGRTTRIRGLQTHATTVQRAMAGSRVAVNLSGVAVNDVRRGDVVSATTRLVPSRQVDVNLRLLANSPVDLHQNDAVEFFVGAAEVPARLTLLDRERLRPGETGWLQMRLGEPVAVMRGDRFIVRRPSPSVTIGGGIIVDATPPRHRRFRPEVLGSLETLLEGSPDDLVLHAVDERPREFRELRDDLASGLPESLNSILARLLSEGDVCLLGSRPPSLRPGTIVASTRWWDRTATQLQQIVETFHSAQPLRRGMPREQLKGTFRLPPPPRLFDELLTTAQAEGIVIDDGQTVRLADFVIQLDAPRRVIADRYLTALRLTPYAPPSPVEFGVDQLTLGALESLGEVVKVADGVVFAADAFDAIVRDILLLLDQRGRLTLAAVRDHFGTSRKFAQALLEHLDQRRVTRRLGDERVRYVGPGAGGGR